MTIYRKLLSKIPSLWITLFSISLGFWVDQEPFISEEWLGRYFLPLKKSYFQLGI